MCKIFSQFWGSFQQYCSNLSTKAFLWPYVSYMVGKLLMWELIICGLEDFLVISERLRILRTARDSNEGYISKCVIRRKTVLKYELSENERQGSRFIFDPQTRVPDPARYRVHTWCWLPAQVVFTFSSYYFLDLDTFLLTPTFFYTS